MPPDRKTLSDWTNHWRDETDAAYLYGVLASIEPDPERAAVFRRFVAVEEKHVGMWVELLARNGVRVDAAKPSVRARLLAWAARRFGPNVLLSMLFREEGREVKGYLKLHRDSASQGARDTALTLATESAEHAEGLRRLTDVAEGEAWHRVSSGGFLRNIVYGFNDGLTANFGLVAGIIGASSVASAGHDVLVAGVAGIVADALSMASSGYLAAKSQLEVYAHEIALERQEIELMPEAEEEELALIYETRGIGREQARAMAADAMRTGRALDEKVREELGIATAHTTPVKEGVLTGVATAIGALLPVLPFLFSSGTVAVWSAFSLAMVSHFGVGAARSLFTGRGIVRSGIDMFIVGLGVAVVGYLVGEGLVRLL